MKNNKLNYKIINITALMLLLYITFSNIGLWWGVLSKCISLLSPFIIGFIFAYAFTPLVRWLTKRGLNKNFSVLIVVLLLVLLVVGILVVTLPLVYNQLSLLIKMIMKISNNVDNKFNINLGKYEIRLTDYLNGMLDNLSSSASTTTFNFLNVSFNFIGKFIVGFVGFIYFLADMGKIRSTIKDFLISHNKRTYNYLKLMDIEITNYLKGLEIFMVIQFFEYSILFFIVGHPNWLILGILACITTVIPYFGGLITNIIAIILASVVSIPLMIATTIICLIFPQIDGYVISPRVYGKTNNVNPLITIMAVSVGGTLAGVAGIVAALPTYLLLRTTYKFFKGDLKKGVVMVKENI